MNDALLQLGSASKPVRSVLLVNLGYPHGKPQTFLPGGLLNLGSRLKARGITVGLIDLNFDTLTLEMCRNYQAVGVTIIGSAMIPQAFEMLQSLRSQGYAGQLLLGGPLVATLTDEDVADITSELPTVQCIRSDADLASFFGHGILSKQETSMVPMLDQVAADNLPLLVRYLTNEFCLYTSSGCVYKCAFCAAPENAHAVGGGGRESYRNLDLLEEEVHWICNFLVQHTSERRIRMYLSNLDAFQTYPKLMDMLERVNRVATEFGITPLMRCLATPHYTYLNLRNKPEDAKRIRALGLYEVGLGVDGLGPKYWKATDKNQNKMPEILQAMFILKKADIIAEMLMVQGGRADNFLMMLRSYCFCVFYALRGFVTRTYMAKEPPGSKFWKDLPRVERQQFWREPYRFKLLDFTMNASVVTHPNWWKRVTSNLFFTLTVRTLQPFGRCTTNPLAALPLNPARRARVELYNSRVPFDK